MIFLLTFVYSQNRKISAHFLNEKEQCNYELKQIKISKKANASDAIQFNYQDTVCDFSSTLDLDTGNYRFIVKTASFEQFEFEFRVEKDIFEINLGNLNLWNKTSNLEEITITGVPKKFFQIDPEKTIVTVENNAIMEGGTIYEAILKIPGIIPSPSGGFTFSGQFTSIFFEGIPSTLSPSDQDNLLRSLPRSPDRSDRAARCAQLREHGCVEAQALPLRSPRSWSRGSSPRHRSPH